jgi:glycosyltransferase involved in cell wall biosynthesis
MQEFPHKWQYLPWFLRQHPAPLGTDIVLCNSWNAFAFRRPGTVLVAVEHLFVLDPALAPYKSLAQAFFHHGFVWHFEKATRRNADRIVAVSSYTASAYQAKLGGEPPQVILNGIDTDFFTPPPGGREPLANRPLRILFVGNLSRRKGADLLVPIMQHLGDGFELSYTAGLRADDALPTIRNPRKLGRLDQAGVRDEYRRADVLLFPTRLEGLPLVAMEAMACGTPVVASSTASLPEVIKDGITGSLCRLNDSRSFANAIISLAANPGKLSALGSNARGAAVAEFSLERMAEDYCALFADLMH